VLSVLLAIVQPTIKTVRNAAMRRQAAVEATALAQAAIRYKTEYGFWPGELEIKSLSEGTVKLNTAVPQQNDPIHLIVYGPQDFVNDITIQGITDPNFLKLYDNAAGRAPYKAFSKVAGPPQPPAAQSVNPLNPRGIAFLQLQNEADPQRIDYLDPWGQSYRLVMGLNPHSVFHFNVKDNNGALIQTQAVSNQIAFAYSVGPPIDRGTNHIYSAGVTPGRVL
jgi:type II secretory pathway pseudopilin PulG